MRRLSSNPKYDVDPQIAEDIIEYVKRGRPFALTLEWSKEGRRRTIFAVPGRGYGSRRIAIVLPERREMAVVDKDFFNSPTTVHWLYGVAKQLPEELHDWQLTEFITEWGSGKIDTKPTGYTIGRFLGEVRLVQEESLVRTHRDEEPEPKTFEYWALRGPTEMRWYHATLRENLDSIFRTGLEPSRLGTERREGWSPGWNIHLQNAVYLTASPAYALSIAETIAIRNEKDAAVVIINGSGLDTKLLSFDEDALRDREGDIRWGDIDQDFPEWVTGVESLVNSVAYYGVVSPEHMKLFAVVRYREVEFERGPEEEEEPGYEVEIEYVGREARKIAKEEDL